MRTAAPLSLLMVTLCRADTDDIAVAGPFSTIVAMDGVLCGRPYPEQADSVDQPVATLDREANRWTDAAGHDLIFWSITTVDDLLARGTPAEKKKAAWVQMEFTRTDETTEGDHADRELEP